MCRRKDSETMQKYMIPLVIIATLMYVMLYHYAKYTLEVMHLDIDIYLFLLIPMVGLVFGFLINLFYQEFQIEKKINLIYLLMSGTFLLMYYYPLIAQDYLFLGPILNLIMSPIRNYVFPILSGFYLSKGIFINKSST